VYKVSKRIDDDISTVCASYYLQFEDGHISDFRTGFGGLAATPQRASRLEQLVVGKTIDDELIARANLALAEDFQPITDARASADYRLSIAQNLFRRLCLEVCDTSTLTRVGAHV